MLRKYLDHDLAVRTLRPEMLLTIIKVVEDLKEYMDEHCPEIAEKIEWSQIP
jgi:hypothetical protein